MCLVRTIRVHMYVSRTEIRDPYDCCSTHAVGVTRTVRTVSRVLTYGMYCCRLNSALFLQQMYVNRQSYSSNSGPEPITRCACVCGVYGAGSLHGCDAACVPGRCHTYMVSTAYSRHQCSHHVLSVSVGRIYSSTAEPLGVLLLLLLLLLVLCGCR